MKGRHFAEESKAENPELLRSTKLRKQVTKLFQLLNLDQQELEQVARFTGHDIRVPCDFHRQREKTLQLPRISKLLLADEKETETIKDQNLNTLNFSLPVWRIKSTKTADSSVQNSALTGCNGASLTETEDMREESSSGSLRCFLLFLSVF
ncbi:hypothetical protein MHYP_G00092680 [Metynnis hypsauchen]